MVKRIISTAIAAIVIAGSAQLHAQTSSVGLARTCQLAGTFRINVNESDKLYSVVKDATSTVPFGDQQRFFIDLSTRLTPPDMLAIDCNGNRVSVGSSRAAKITYVADGQTRRERGASGNFVNSKVELARNTLTFISRGRGEDNVNVAFEAVNGGSRLRVTRRIHAAQLSEPIIIRTVYEKITDRVDWGIYDNNAVASGTAGVDQDAKSDRSGPNVRGSNREAAELRVALNEWIEATNRRDISAQMRFYVPLLKAYYLSRNTPQSAVLAEKRRVFSGVRAVDIRAAEPEIIFQDNGRTAVMRFIKEYKIVERTRTKSGVVVQELRWQRYGNDWQIFSERDIRVIR